MATARIGRTCDHFTPFAKPVDDELLKLLAQRQRALVNLWLVVSIVVGASLGGSLAVMVKRAPEIARAFAMERPA